MNDVAEITALIHEYPANVDRGDFHALGAMFTDGVLFSPRGEARGPAAVAAWYSAVRIYDDGTPQTLHHPVGIEVDVDGDTATAHSYITVIQHRKPIISASYDDTFVRVDGTWRFATRTVSMDLLGDLRGHLDL